MSSLDMAGYLTTAAFVILVFLAVMFVLRRRMLHRWGAEPPAEPAHTPQKGKPTRERPVTASHQEAQAHKNSQLEQRAIGERERARREELSWRQRGGHKNICPDCGAEIEVPFRPTPGRPVYCRNCYQKHRTPQVSTKIPSESEHYKQEQMSLAPSRSVTGEVQVPTSMMPYLTYSVDVFLIGEVGTEETKTIRGKLLVERLPFEVARSGPIIIVPHGEGFDVTPRKVSAGIPPLGERHGFHFEVSPRFENEGQVKLFVDFMQEGALLRRANADISISRRIVIAKTRIVRNVITVF